MNPETSSRLNRSLDHPDHEVPHILALCNDVKGSLNEEARQNIRHKTGKDKDSIMDELTRQMSEYTQRLDTIMKG